MDTVIKGSDLTIGIDIGGTKISAGVVDSSGNIIDSSKCSSALVDQHLLMKNLNDQDTPTSRNLMLVYL